MDQLMENFKSQWANIKTNCKKKVTWCDVERYGWALLSVDFVVAIRCTAIWPQASLPNSLPHIRPESLGSEYDGPNVLNPWARTIHCPPHCFSWYFVIVLETWVAHVPTSALSHTHEDSPLDSPTHPIGTSTSVLGTFQFQWTHSPSALRSPWRLSSFPRSRCSHDFLCIYFRWGPKS